MFDVGEFFPALEISEKWEQRESDTLDEVMPHSLC